MSMYHIKLELEILASQGWAAMVKLDSLFDANALPLRRFAA